MRILYYTDPHNSDKAPRMREDDYFSTILEKQEQLIEPAQKADLVICGGDIFHRKLASSNSYRLTNSLLEIYREFGNTLIIPGNHDFNNHVDELFSSSPFALFDKLSNVEIVHNRVIRVDDKVKIFGFGCGEYYKRETVVHACDKFSTNYFEEGVVLVGVLHQPITGKNYIFETMPLKTVTRFFDVVLLGHLHDYQAKGMSAGCSYVAPGGLSRGILRLDENYDRPVQYAVVDIVKEHVQTTFIPLKYKPADEVFRIDEKLTEEYQKKAVGNLLNFIGALKIPQVKNIEDLEVLIDEYPIEDEVKFRAKEILRRV